VSDALAELLRGLIDYAGLFPPASLDLPAATRNYAAYRKGPHAWMLGRFVIPADLVPEADPSLPLSVIAPGKKSERAGDVEYIEIPVDGAGLQPGMGPAKIRTGGATPDAYPSAAALAHFLHRAAALRIPFKATAGLHHPLPSPPMHGFVNLFLAACLVWHGGTEAQAVATLEERSFRFDGDASWGHHRLTADQIREARWNFAISFGSCSFEEPIEDLARLGWL
jgi:hypothetical protein